MEATPAAHASKVTSMMACISSKGGALESSDRTSLCRRQAPQAMAAAAASSKAMPKADTTNRPPSRPARSTSSALTMIDWPVRVHANAVRCACKPGSTAVTPPASSAMAVRTQARKVRSFASEKR
jgi:hypothetical protein